MRFILSLLAAAAGIYSLLIFIRILLSWFSDIAEGKPVKIIKSITDPYLNWWRRHLNLRVGMLDFSAVAAIVFLSLLQFILMTLSVSEKMSFGIILAEVLLSIWRIVSFILGFFIVVILIRLIGYLTGKNAYSPFWSIVDSISQPVIYRINRIIFGNRITNFVKSIVISILFLAVITAGGWFIFNFIANILWNLPV
ncbi:MAG: YggT family protein [Treponema sp.]|nr:YggT family protein [Treponema sp.]